MVGIFQAELDVGAEPFLEALNRVGHGLVNSVLLADEAGESFLANAIEKVGFVLKIEIDSSGRILNLLGDLAHGDILEAFPHKHIARGIENFLAKFFLFAGPAFLNSHKT